MFSVIKLITLVDQQSSDLRAELSVRLKAGAEALPGMRTALTEPTLNGVFNGGDIIWRVQFDDRFTYEAARESREWKDGVGQLLANEEMVASIQSAAYRPIKSGGRSPGKGIYRAALFCANRNATPERLDAWAAETADMPTYVNSIRSWQLGKIVKAAGSRPWTHVWEQEYESLEGLMGPYMMHPCHWAQVDRWFDPEYPEWLVDTELCHTFCATHQQAIVLP